jgi:hypothetical protein
LEVSSHHLISVNLGDGRLFGIHGGGLGLERHWHVVTSLGGIGLFLHLHHSIRIALNLASQSRGQDCRGKFEGHDEAGDESEEQESPEGNVASPVELAIDALSHVGLSFKFLLAVRRLEKFPAEIRFRRIIIVVVLLVLSGSIMRSVVVIIVVFLLLGMESSSKNLEGRHDGGSRSGGGIVFDGVPNRENVGGDILRGTNFIAESDSPVGEHDNCGDTGQEGENEAQNGAARIESQEASLSLGSSIKSKAEKDNGENDAETSSKEGQDDIDNEQYQN